MTPRPKSPLRKDGIYAALSLLENATSLLKTTRAIDFAFYYIGTLPFLWQLTHFCAEMSRSAHAERRLWPMANVLAITYVWMKIGQTLFVQRLLHLLRDRPQTWSLREWTRVVVRAAVIQTSAPIITAFAACLLIPTAWTIAFYHHVQSSTYPEQKNVLSTVRGGLTQSQLWPWQNHALLSMHAAFGLLVFVNVWVTLLSLPQLLHTLLGLETQLLVSSASPFNSTLVIAAAALTWALTDPFLKAAYAVRAFQAESVTTGRDLSIAWQRTLVEKTLILGVLLSVSLFPVLASAEVADAGTGSVVVTHSESLFPARAAQLDRKLSEVLKRPEFAWQMPRDMVEPEVEEPNAVREWLSDLYHSVEGTLKKVFGWLEDVVKWFLDLGEPAAIPGASTSSGWGKLADRSTFLIVGIAILIPLIVILRQYWRNRGPSPSVPTTVRIATVNETEGMEAAKLPADEWKRQAEQWLAKGERRLALRAMFLGELALLFQQGHLVAASHKSVGDYRRDLERRVHILPKAYQGYCATARLFEGVWYGNQTVTDDVIEQFSLGAELLRQDV